MSIMDIIILAIYVLLNIAAIICFNLITVKKLNIDKKLQIRTSIIFVFFGVIYWVVIAFNSIRYKINKKNQNNYE